MYQTINCFHQPIVVKNNVLMFIFNEVGSGVERLFSNMLSASHYLNFV